MIISAAILFFVNLALIGGSLGQEEIALADSVLQKASEVTNLQGLNASALPVEEAKNAFKNKCQTNGGADAYTNAENAAKEIASCMQNLVNVTLLQDEIERAKPTGDLDIVFRKYCNKSPTLKTCVKNFTDTVGTCFTQKERDNINIVQNITDQLLNFVCFKEGDRIALFIAAGGPECFTSKQSVIQDCVNSTFGSYVPAEGLSTPNLNGMDNLPLLLLDSKECSDIERLQTCMVRELETCNDPTPGNIVDSLFNFIKKVTPCENLLSKARAEASVSADIDVVSSASIFGAQFIVIAISVFSLMGIRI
ncbi:27 kDa hemolymph protein-like [Venturia canescens]|uniref:27 kDa hemolymph protein-like n=1 Tax=Venturia canescens TaxID=32260 RepID=UPI001C9D1A57|nr:27 kDa hemolymph protein-like [Venturia canescens]